MLFTVKIRGTRPIIMHSTAALDPRRPEKLEIAEITKKPAKNRTEQDEHRIRDLECGLSLWVDEAEENVTIPPSAFRACIENGARKLKQGPLVREGMIVTATSAFLYDEDKYGTTLEEIARSTRFSVPVVVQRARLIRTRAKFDEWAAVFQIETDDEIVDESMLTTWIDIAGRRCGLGDWRPQKSGTFGRFKMTSIEGVKED